MSQSPSTHPAPGVQGTSGFYSESKVLNPSRRQIAGKENRGPPGRHAKALSIFPSSDQTEVLSPIPSVLCLYEALCSLSSPNPGTRGLGECSTQGQGQSRVQQSLQGPGTDGHPGHGSGKHQGWAVSTAWGIPGTAAPPKIHPTVPNVSQA